MSVADVERNASARAWVVAADRKQARVVLRFVRGLLAAPPFSPDAGVDEFAALLKSYRVTKVLRQICTRRDARVGGETEV
jgi:hypothetical protein